MGNHADDDLKCRKHDIQHNTDERALACNRVLIYALRVAENVDMKYEISVSDTRFYQGRPVNPANTHKFLI